MQEDLEEAEDFTVVAVVADLVASEAAVAVAFTVADSAVVTAASAVVIEASAAVTAASAAVDLVTVD